MRKWIGMTAVLLFATTLAAQQPGAPAKTVQPPPSGKPSAFVMSVGISVDAPPEMRWVILDQLTRRLKNTRNLNYVEKDPDWVITVVAFDPFPKEKDPKKKQFSMSTGFLQQLVWTDPALLEDVRNDPCVKPERLAEFQKSQRKTSDLFTMGAYAGNVDELKSTVNDLVDDFIHAVLEPAKQNYETQGMRMQQDRSQQPLKMHQTERPKNWPPVPPKKP